MSESMSVRLPALDGLRGLAALLVFLSHADYYDYINLLGALGIGKIGVGLFYVLSGFLMAHLYIERPLVKDSISAYFAARVSRVFPLFYAALFGSVALFVVFGHSGYAYNTASEFFLNLLMLKGSGVLWSIPVEVQYYIVFIGLWWASRNGYLSFAIFFLTVAQIFFAAYFYSLVGDQNYLFFWIHFFLAGLLLSQLCKRVSIDFAPATSMIAFSISILLLPWFREYIGVFIPPVFADPFSVLFVLVTFVFGLSGNGPYRVLLFPLARKLGDLSFGIYLLHMPIIFLVNSIGLKSFAGKPLSFLAICLTTLVCAAISRMVIEIPMGARLRDAFSPKHHKA